MITDSFDGWIPYRRVSDGSGDLLWCYTGDLPFTDPFFMDTIARAFRRPYTALFTRRTSPAETAALCDSSDVLPAAGFILHVSRCGSTLVSRTLAGDERSLVLSEPPAFDQALRGTSDDDQLRNVLRALSRRRSAAQERVIVKLDCWHTMAIPRLRNAFPNVPMIFIHRDPVEVLVSQMTRPSAWTVPGALPVSWFGFPASDVLLSREELCARLIGAMCSAAAAAVEKQQVRAIPYTHLPEGIFTEVSPCFGIEISSFDMEIMRRMTQVDAKSAGSTFVSDSKHKQMTAKEQIRCLALEHISPHYSRLY